MKKKRKQGRENKRYYQKNKEYFRNYYYRNYSKEWFKQKQESLYKKLELYENMRKELKEYIKKLYWYGMQRRFIKHLKQSRKRGKMKDYKGSFDKGSKKLNDALSKKYPDLIKLVTEGFYDNRLVVATDKCTVLCSDRISLMSLACKLLHRMLLDQIITEKDLDYMISLVKESFKNERK